LIEPELLAAALEILSESGPEGFTVRAIARRARVAPMAIYSHFGDKNGLLEAIWIEGFTKLRETLEASPISVEDGLLRSAQSYRQFALSHPTHYTVMFMHRFVGFTPSMTASTVAYNSFDVLVGQVRHVQSSGMFPDCSPGDAAQMMWSTCHGFVSLEIMGMNFAFDHDATFIDFVRGIEKGLATPRR
jgi:AcrR family transcriptional regulator